MQINHYIQLLYLKISHFFKNISILINIKTKYRFNFQLAFDMVSPYLFKELSCKFLYRTLKSIINKQVKTSLQIQLTIYKFIIITIRTYLVQLRVAIIP